MPRVCCNGPDQDDPPPSDDAAPNPPGPRRRRPRYTGSHPRRFDERYKEQTPDRYPELIAHVRAQGRTPAGAHVPIMVDEVLAALRPVPGEIAVDATLGYGGHAEALLRAITPGGVLIGLDRDAAALEATAERLRALLAVGGPGPRAGVELPPEDPGGVRLHFARTHFAGLGHVLRDAGRDGCDVLLADLGASSMQLDDPTRGFSYKHDGPLDMRMDTRTPRTAADLLATLSAAELADAFRTITDEPDAERIAELIVARRSKHRLAHTRDLADLVLDAKGLTHKTWRQPDADSHAAQVGLHVEAHAAPPGSPVDPHALHPAARVFLALRILVNDELRGLEQFLRAAPYCLHPGGRLAMLTFHSGEARRVEAALQAGRANGLYATISDAPVRPTPAEQHANPRSRAAALYWALRTA
jgi:16S rRNA (cytosine1402-N4)-methyltransferase